MTLGLCCRGCDILDIQYPDRGPHSCKNVNPCDGHSIPAHVTKGKLAVALFQGSWLRDDPDPLENDPDPLEGMLWAVVCDTAGAHEAECVYSLWSSETQAEAEILRLHTEGVQRGCYGGNFYAVAVKTNTPRDTWIW